MNIYYRVMLLVIVEAGLMIVAAYIVERSMAGALKGLKSALKFEFTTAVGRLNLAGMVLLLFATIFLNLHETVASALSASNPPQDHVMGAAILLTVFFMGSLLCVMVVERK